MQSFTITNEARDLAPLGAVRHPSVRRPRDAATMILIDRSKRLPRFLLGKRNPNCAFLPGRFVFPGGRVEAFDGRMNAYGALAGHVEQRLTTRVQRPSSQRARAYPLAAIRELAEETGLLLGEADLGTPGIPADDWRVFAERGIFPSLDGIWFIARTITPLGLSRRFDTRFFAADAAIIAGEVKGVVGPDAELVELAWVTSQEAQDLDLHPITRIVLDELTARLEHGLERNVPVPFYHPRGSTMLREEI